MFTASAHLGLINLVQAIFEPGYRVGGHSLCGQVALHEAVIRGNMAIVKYLVQNGAQIDMSGQHGMTPLFYAIETGEHDIANFLLASGCAVNYRHGELCTPLQEAASLGQVEIVKVLIASGADVNAELQFITRRKEEWLPDEEVPWQARWTSGRHIIRGLKCRCTTRPREQHTSLKSLTLASVRLCFTPL